MKPPAAEVHRPFTIRDHDKAEWRSECPCGWQYGDPDLDHVELTGQRHQLEHQTGTAIVECVMCEDRLPVSAAQAIMDQATLQPRYLCDDCAAIRIGPVDPEAVRADLLRLEQELR